MNNQQFSDNLDDEELNEEERNDILKNLGVEERIDDVAVFFGDAFYIQFFQAAFPEIDFSQLEEATNEEDMAGNIQTLIDLLGSQILKYDLSHIKGEEIVSGNPEHCINLLQLVQEISVMLDAKQEEGGQQMTGMEGEEDDDEDLELVGSTAKKQRGQEDEEAQIIHEKRQKQQQLESPQQPSNQKQNAQISHSQNQSNNKRGRSYSDDRGKPQFDLDDIDISNEFNVGMEGDDDDDDDDDDDEEEMMFQQQQLQQQMHQQQQRSADQSKGKIQQSQQKQQIIDDYQEDDDEEELDEDDQKMYEQFLANNKQQEQQLAMIVDEQKQGQFGSAPAPHAQQMGEDQEDEYDDEDIDLDNIDYDDLDPQILELAEQMGVHPKEVIKQMLKMQKDGYGDEDDEGEEMDEEELMELQAQQQHQMQQQQQQQRQQQSSHKKPQQQQRTKPLPHELVESDEESYYSEGELISRDKVANRKSYSAPYIIINDCFDEPLYDSEEEKDLESANTTTIMKNLEMQEQLAEAMGGQHQGSEEEDMDEETAQMLMAQQQQMMLMQQQQHQKQASKITEVSKSKESSQLHGKPKSASDQKNRMQQQQIMDEDEEELDIDVGQKLMQLQQQQQHYQDDLEEQDNGEDQDEDDEDMLIDLDKLDETNKQMLLEYLHQEYEKNPDQFPFPKELIEEQLMKQYQQQQQKQGQRQDTESVRDIKSDEMIVEETSNQKHGIEGGSQDIEQEGQGEDEEELTPEQQMQLQQLQILMMQQQQQEQQEQDYGEEQDEQAQLEQLQMLQQQYQQQNMMMGQQPKSKKKVVRPKSAGKKKVQPSNLLTKQQQQLQEQLLQQQILAELMQNQELDVENMDPNILQQLIIAQSQQMQMQASHSKVVKRKTSVPKKTKPVPKKLLPYQVVPKSMKVLGPSTPGTHFKSFNTNRSQQQQQSKKKRKSSAKKQQPTMQYAMTDDQMMQQQQQQPQFEMPVLSEEYLNQLSEEQLQQLLEHQQQLMIMQQQNHQQQVMPLQPKKSLRPKSAKSTKLSQKSTTRVPQTYQQYYQPYMNTRRKSNGKVKKGTKKKKRVVDPIQAMMANPQNFAGMDHQGVMMNNYFPALEAGGQLSQHTEDGSLSKDSRYPKFSHDMVNNLNMHPGQMQQDPIDEVPPEQEDAESHENVPHFYGHHQQQMTDEQDDQVVQGEDQDIDQDGMQQDQDVGVDDEGGPTDGGYEISDEQLIQLIQNAHNLSPEQQQQLQMILQERMKNEMMNDRAQSYQNIYQILMDNVRKAKDRLAGIGLPNGSIDAYEGETDRRILKQKQEFEALYKQYHQEVKQKEIRKRHDNGKSQKTLQRESKIQMIKERKFQEDLLNHQKSLNYKRNAQQVRLCQKVYKLASDLEKNKLLAEKKEYKETIQKKKHQSKQMVDAMENFYKNMVSMLKDKIDNERLERKIAQSAQQQAMARMKRELNQQKRSEVDRYLQLLKQEDQRYDFESTNLQKIEQEIIKLYKKK